MTVPSLASQGYRMPAEWEKHSGIFLAWPYDDITFPDRVKNVEEIYAKIIEEFSKDKESEIVNLIVRDNVEKERIQELLQQKNIDFS